MRVCMYECMVCMLKMECISKITNTLELHQNIVYEIIKKDLEPKDDESDILQWVCSYVDNKIAF